MSKSDVQEVPDGAAETPARPERKATMRLAQRELSIISATVVLVICLGLAAGGYHVYRGFKSQRDIVIAKSNLIALYKALCNYAQDWDGRLPPADHWTDSVGAYLSVSPGTPGGPRSLLQGPGDGKPVGYVYNDLASGYNLEPSVTTDDRQRALPMNRLVLLIERPGAMPNEHVRIPSQSTTEGQQALFKQLAFPHNEDDEDNATTVMLLGSGALDVKTRRDCR